MPKLPEKFEDWTPPWKDDEFDAEKAARLVFNAKLEAQREKESHSATKTKLSETETAKDELQTQIDAKANEGKSDLEKAQAEIEKLKNAKPQVDPETAKKLLRAEVALDKGLTAFQAKRLVGETREELEADAEELVKAFGGAGEVEEGSESEEGPGQRRPRPVTNRRTKKDDEETGGSLPDFTPDKLDELVPMGWS